MTSLRKQRLEEAQIVQVPCLNDNYSYLIHDPNSDTTVVIDTPDSEVIKYTLNENQWTLDYILTTHHHWDHIDGHQDLVETYGCQVIGSKTNELQIPHIQHSVIHGDSFKLGSLNCNVIATPGHTLGHVVYYFPELSAIFTGDTLFSMGCGRLFEGTPGQMWHSMQALKDLPEMTQIYCGHEYTLANAKFASSIEPDNPNVKARAKEVQILRDQDQPTIPSSLRTELKTNPFLRADDHLLQKALNLEDQSAEKVFTHIRQLKDTF